MTETDDDTILGPGRYTDLIPTPVELAKIRNGIRAEHERQFNQSNENMNKRMAAILKLADQGIVVRLTKHNIRCGVTTDVCGTPQEVGQYLRRCRNALGPMKVVGKDIKDAGTAMIWVYVGWDEAPNIKFRYARQLPPDGDCRIETQYSGPSSYQTLVCSRKKVESPDE